MEKTLVFLRTSTKEQNPELQRNDCLNFCKERNLEVVEVYVEQQSAFKKDKKREIFEKVIDRMKKEKISLVLWRYDRAFRNKKEFYEFMRVAFEVYGVKVYSVKENSILTLWELLDKTKIEDVVMNELMQGILKVLWKFVIQQAGEEAEEESRKRSERVKLAVKKDGDGKAISYRGNKWGRKKKKLDINYILELKKTGLTLQEIADKYNEGRKKKKQLTKQTVFNLLKSVKESKDSLSE